VLRGRLGRCGAALLEAMIALVILSAAAIGAVGLIAAGLRAEHQAQHREQAIAAADRVLTASTLLLRAELDQRLGDRRVGELIVRVAHPEPTLYRIAVTELARPDVEMLTTVVYRPVAASR
jgi:hypothetical protein